MPNNVDLVTVILTMIQILFLINEMLTTPN